MEQKINIVKKVFQNIDINIENFDSIEIPRESLLDNQKYTDIVNSDLIIELKNVFSSTYMNTLHTNANTKQKTLLLNFIRQLLKNIDYKLVPIRRCNGYINKKKQYYRCYIITKITDTDFINNENISDTDSAMTKTVYISKI